MTLPIDLYYSTMLRFFLFSTYLVYFYEKLRRVWNRDLWEVRASTETFFRLATMNLPIHYRFYVYPETF